MNILAFAHSPLAWRPLLPVVVELARRSHTITIQTTRANWRGLPTFQMAFRPRFVTGINKSMLDWVSRLDGFGEAWEKAQERIRYTRWFVPEHYDCALATTKELDELRNLEREINGCMKTFAIGCQHWPVMLRHRFDPWNEESGSKRDEGVPAPFKAGHPFADYHRFGGMLYEREMIPCGFPHLDQYPQIAPSQGNRVHLIHHGGYRGLKGHAWMLSILRACHEAGYVPSISAHGIHGYGYAWQDLSAAIHKARMPRILGNPQGWQSLVDQLGLQGTPVIIAGGTWRTIVSECAVVLTTGSATIYDLWSIGHRNVLVLDYLGGGRSKAFQVVPDILVRSEQELIRRLRERQYAPTNHWTSEIIDAFSSLHTGCSTKTAADVVEGKQ